MDADRWRQIERIFHAAQSLDARARESFVRGACGADDALHREVASLLAYGDDDPTILSRWPFNLAPATMPPEPFDGLTGHLAAGRYRIGERIGAGGMGVVYRAVDEQLGRPVAIKFLPRHLSLDSGRLTQFTNEARALSALNHPNIVTVHEVGEAGGASFIAMELVDGPTLRERLRRGALPLGEALDIVQQTAVALAAAHERGIVHRDLKPENVMVRTDGYVKIVDFGLAALRVPAAAAAPAGTPGEVDPVAALVGGTPAYMAPEQLSGAAAAPGNDIFALGVLLCELTTGTNPLRAASAADTIDALARTPASALAAIAGLPPALAPIVETALQHDPSRRQVSAAALADDVRAARAAIDAPKMRDVRRTARWYALAAAVVMAAASAAAVVAYRRAERVQWVREQAMPGIERLTGDDRFVAAFRLLQEAERYLPGDRALAELAGRATRIVTINSTPPGARVAVRDYLAGDGDWLPLGETPLNKVRIPGGYLAWRIVSPAGEMTAAPPTADVMTFDVAQASAAPSGMVPVRGQRFLDYLAYFGWVGPYELPPFFIDRFEVTNAEYQRFVDAGGYRRRELWKQPFVTDGRALTWDQAMTRFRDASGQSGPSTWSAGHFPEGRADYPVGGISWFEAAAFAEFAGKSLPVIAQSYVAAPASLDRYVSRLRDPSGELLPVGRSRTFGPYGTADLLGNVREWYWNATPDGLRYVLGRLPSFYGPTAVSPFDRSAVNGVRCVINSKPVAPDVVAARPILRRDFANAKPAPDEVFRIYKNIYGYDASALRPSVETVPDQAGDWTTEKITVDAAYGNERLTLFLLLPRQAKRPLQAVVFFPSARVLSLPNSSALGDLSFVDHVIRSGRAVIYPIYQGMYERRSRVSPAGGPVVLRDTTVAWSRDFGRAIDYLQSRPDIDGARIGFLGVSMGSAYGVILTSLESRVKAVVLLDGGFFQVEHPLDGTDQVDFAPRVRQPVLMVNGRYDATYPLEQSQLPLFRLLGAAEGDKRHVLLETGHDVRVQRAAMTRETLAWFDKYLGPVGH
jgi:dienelactone hydrolase